MDRLPPVSGYSRREAAGLEAVCRCRSFSYFLTLYSTIRARGAQILGARWHFDTICLTWSSLSGIQKSLVASCRISSHSLSKSLWKFQCKIRYISERRATCSATPIRGIESLQTFPAERLDDSMFPHTTTTPSYSAIAAASIQAKQSFRSSTRYTFALSEKFNEQSFHGTAHAESSEEQSHVCG